MTEGCNSEARDWAGSLRSLTHLWGVPLAAMTVASFLPPTARAVVWVAMLVWMGAACLVNAWRTGRTHCWLTGPFFLIMAALVAAYAAKMLPLGPHGWAVLGAFTAIGFPLLWWGSERLLGRFVPFGRVGGAAQAVASPEVAATANRP